MAGTKFSLDWGGLQSAIGSAAAGVDQSQELMEAIGESLVSSTQDRFEEGKAPDGSAWKPSQRVQEHGGQTLVKSARLKNSIGYAASPSQLSVGTNVVYARIHQQGGKAGKRHSVTLPERAFLGFSAEDLQEAREMVKEHMAQVLGMRR